MDRELRILILEDDSADAELIQRELRNAGITFSPMLVHSREGFIKGLEEFSPDLILADYKLPSFDGISALDISQKKCPNIPFIFVTGTMGEEWAVETLKRGASDYVIKDRIYRLASVVKRALQDAKELTERKQAEEKYHSIFENALEGIFQVLPDGRYVTANPAFVNMLGYKSPSEFITKVTDIGYQLCVQPERYNKLKQLLEEHSIVQGFEIQMYRKDGSIIWISLNARTICDDHGTLLYYEGTAQDITEQKKIRDVVKPSTLLLRLLGIFAAVEVLIMFVFSITDIPHGIWENLADAVLLTILCAPFVYLWIVKGLTRHLLHEVTVAQTEAQANEYRYQTLIDTVPDIIYTLAAGDGIITLLNPAFETVTGWSRNEWIGKTFNAIVHPDDLQFAIETYQQIMRGENPPSYELRILTKSGTYLVGEFTSVPHFELGKIVGVLGIARDITERKLAEKAMREHAEQYRTMVSSTLFGFWLVDENGKLLDVNDTYCCMSGYTREELLNLSVSDLEVIDKPENIARRIQKVVEIGADQFESKHKAKDGQDFDVEISTGFLYSQKQLIVFIRNITDRKRAEQEIISQKNKFAQLFENSPIAIALLDDQDKIIHINESFSTLFGYFLEEVKGQMINDIIVPPELEEEAKTYSNETLSGNQINKESYRMIKDGTIVYVQIVGVPAMANDKIVGVYSMYVDLTHRKDAEEKMKMAKELAEQSDKLKTEFLAQMSHEIRTPINAIVGNVDFLNDSFGEKTDSDTRDCFEGIGLASKRIIRTVDLILNAAELQTSGYKPYKVKVDLNSEILNKLYKEHQLLAKQKGLEFIYSCKEKVANVIADSYSITQIFANLIDNAIKYTKKGKVEILLDKNSSGNIMVEIKDTGIGMSKEFQARMFEPFLQEDHGFTRSYDGSGLGLTLVKNYCDINNAVIEVESEKNVGSTFRVIFK